MPLTRIFHLSDLHIRNGDNIYSRYEEYRSVFAPCVLIVALSTRATLIPLTPLPSPADPHHPRIRPLCPRVVRRLRHSRPLP